MSEWGNGAIALVLALAFFALVGLTTWYQRRQWPKRGDAETEEWGAG